MDIDTIPEVLDHLVEKPLRNHVEINERSYYIDFGGNICIKGTREIGKKVEHVFLTVDSDILFSEIMKTGVIDFNEMEELK